MPQIPVKNYERIELTERDSVLVLNLLEKPPVPNAKLMTAAYKSAGRSNYSHSQPTQTESMESEPPSIPSTGKLTCSCSLRRPRI